jgi:hypothetical protein
MLSAILKKIKGSVSSALFYSQGKGIKQRNALGIHPKN